MPKSTQQHSPGVLSQDRGMGASGFIGVCAYQLGHWSNMGRGVVYCFDDSRRAMISSG